MDELADVRLLLMMHYNEAKTFNDGMGEDARIRDLEDLGTAWMSHD